MCIRDRTKLAIGAVGTGQIATGAIETSKILDGSIGSADLGTFAITNTKIADGAVTSAKLASNLAFGNPSVSGVLSFGAAKRDGGEPSAPAGRGRGPPRRRRRRARLAAGRPPARVAATGATRGRRQLS